MPLSSNPLLHISGVLSICSFPKMNHMAKPPTKMEIWSATQCITAYLGYHLPRANGERSVAMKKMFVSLVLNKRRKLTVEARGIEVLEAAINENLFATTEHCLMRDASLRILSIVAPTPRVLSSSAMRYNFILVHRPVMPPLPCLVELSVPFLPFVVTSQPSCDHCGLVATSHAIIAAIGPLRIGWHNKSPT